MNAKLKITKIGHSAGVVLPKDVLAHLGAAVGEKLSLVTTPPRDRAGSGRARVRDAGAFDSAMMRPRNLTLDGQPDPGLAQHG